MRREPVVTAATVSGVITAAIALLVAFGVHLTHEQIAAVLGFFGVVDPIVLALVARRHVTPVPKEMPYTSGH